MDERTKTARSKLLSFALRHRPDALGLTLDAAGWVPVDALLRACAAHGQPIDRAELEDLVATNAKRRFALSADGLRIRASQGHSVEVALDYAPAEPPDVLFHGTATRALPGIRERGLVRMTRHHVHLAADEATAAAVGARHGRPVVLRVDARRMHAAGHVFYVSANGVWLTDAVPVDHIDGL